MTFYYIYKASCSIADTKNEKNKKVDSVNLKVVIQQRYNCHTTIIHWRLYYLQNFWVLTLNKETDRYNIILTTTMHGVHPMNRFQILMTNIPPKDRSIISDPYITALGIANVTIKSIVVGWVSYRSGTYLYGLNPVW